MIGILCVKKKNASTPGKQKEESESEQMMHIYIVKEQEMENTTGRVPLHTLWLHLISVQQKRKLRGQQT